VKLAYTLNTMGNDVNAKKSLDLKKVRNVGFILGLFPAICTAILQYTLKLTWADTIATAALGYAVLAFIGIWYTLWFTYAQLERALAKPKIKVAFNKDGEQQTTVAFKDGKLVTGIPHPCIINEGNAVARFFQIDFFMPEDIARPTGHADTRRENGKYVLSYPNEGRYTLFVNRPFFDPGMLFSSQMNIEKCYDWNVDEFIIKYHVYGDWAETQEGELKVIIDKQEVSHVPTTG
jgi:hypothetical protein